MLAHPNVHPEWSQWSEEQTIHLVGVYSNPFRWRSRRLHFNDFVRHARSSPNIKLYVVELAYGDRPFEVSQPSDIQLRTDCEMFHKENLINIGVQRFPSNYAGSTAGIQTETFISTRHDWGLEAIHMLQHHAFVQNFSNYADLTSATATSDTGHQMYRHNRSLAWNYLHQAEFKALKQSQQKCDPYYGLPIPNLVEFPFWLSLRGLARRELELAAGGI